MSAFANMVGLPEMVIMHPATKGGIVRSWAFAAE